MADPFTETELATYRARVESWAVNGVYLTGRDEGDRVLATIDALAAGCAPAKQPTFQDVFSEAMLHNGAWLDRIKVLEDELRELRGRLHGDK